MINNYRPQHNPPPANLSQGVQKSYVPGLLKEKRDKAENHVHENERGRSRNTYEPRQQTTKEAVVWQKSKK
jgi:hypothetical protein